MNILTYIKTRLPNRTERLELEAIAEKSGVPFNTLLKIANGATKNPRVSTVQSLMDYYRKLEEGNGKLKAAPHPAELKAT